MKETPLPFCAPMVLALLAGTKTQTRRVFKEPQDYACLTGDCPHAKQSECDAWLAEHALPNALGDHVWVRETFYNDLPGHQDRMHIYYRADGECCQQIPECQCAEVGKPKWKSGRYMPKWAARIWLEVTACRFERLQDISEADAKAEGCVNAPSPVQEFMVLWDSINEAKYPWSSNPLVVVREFKRIKP